MFLERTACKIRNLYGNADAPYYSHYPPVFEARYCKCSTNSRSFAANLAPPNRAFFRLLPSVTTSLMDKV